MAGIFALLYGMLWGTSKIASTVMDENSKAESKTEAIRKRDCVYMDRHGAYYSLRTGERVWLRRLNNRVVYENAKGEIVEDPDLKKIESKKQQETDEKERIAIKHIKRRFQDYIYDRKKYYFLKSESFHTDEYYCTIKTYIKLDENKIYYYCEYKDRYSGVEKEYLRTDDCDWGDITKRSFKEDVSWSMNGRNWEKEEEDLKWIKSYDALLDYDYEAISNEIDEKYGVWRSKGKYYYFN